MDGIYAIAPYWDDIDTRYGSSAISFEIHNSGFYLNQVNTFITRKRSSSFQGTWMAVIFYDRVRPYPSGTSTEVMQYYLLTNNNNEGTKVQNPRRLCHVYTLFIANIHV